MFSSYLSELLLAAIRLLEPEVVPDRLGNASLVYPGSARGPPSNQACLKIRPMEVSRRHPHQMSKPHRLLPLDVEEHHLYTKLLVDDQAWNPTSEGEGPATLPRKILLVACIYDLIYSIMIRAL